jgi:hypothetical protein
MYKSGRRGEEALGAQLPFYFTMGKDRPVARKQRFLEGQEQNRTRAGSDRRNKHPRTSGPLNVIRYRGPTKRLEPRGGQQPQFPGSLESPGFAKLQNYKRMWLIQFIQSTLAYSPLQTDIKNV